MMKGGMVMSYHDWIGFVRSPALAEMVQFCRNQVHPAVLNQYFLEHAAVLERYRHNEGGKRKRDFYSDGAEDKDSKMPRREV